MIGKWTHLDEDEGGEWQRSAQWQSFSHMYGDAISTWRLNYGCLLQKLFNC